MNGSRDQVRELKVCHPGTDQLVWRGPVATTGQVRQAVNVARDALSDWRLTPTDQRIAIAQTYAALATARQAEIADRISLETGKPRWEATAEAKLVAAKVELAIKAYDTRSADQQISLPQGIGKLNHCSVGVMGILGPFNFPAHLPNGHLVPALIAGNTVVFKPSEMTPGTGQLLVELWSEAGLPQGVLGLIQGGREVGADLVAGDVDAILFTGSYAGGSAIHRSLSGRPEVLLALEMGGNNPMVVDQVSDIDAAAYLTALSAYATAGQRCTCARRLILPDGAQVKPLIKRITALCTAIRVGLPRDEPEPFIGPVISTAAAQHVLAAQDALQKSGADVLVAARLDESNPALVHPGLVDVTTVADRPDEEVFGPLLQLIRVNDFDAAIIEANRTRYGLSASLLSDDAARFESFRTRVRAGVVNWNQPTVGASGRLPFGGLGSSGNHRPSGFFAADYCSDVTAILQSDRLVMPSSTPPGILEDS